MPTSSLIEVVKTNAPVFLLHVEICFNLIEYARLDLEQPRSRRLGIRTYNVDNQPLLILALRNRGMPVLNLLLDSILVRFCILHIMST